MLNRSFDSDDTESFEMEDPENLFATDESGYGSSDHFQEVIHRY